MSGRIDRVAKLSLVLALALALLGLWLKSSSSFWGGLLLAFGEAALVGGLADWFAVRALFVRPLGLPFPHTALIPRNRRRLTQTIRDLVVKEWLPVSLLRARIDCFDFVSAGRPALEALRPSLRRFLRDVGVGLLQRAASEEVTHDVAMRVPAGRVGPWLADLIETARARGWLTPLLHAGVVRFRRWAATPATLALIRQRVEQASDSYRDRSLMNLFTVNLAEALGGLDLDDVAATLQMEMIRFAEEQMEADSRLNALLGDGLAELEQRLREDAEAALPPDAFAHAVEPLIQSLGRAGERDLERDDSRLLAAAETYLDSWLSRLSDDAEFRDRVNVVCRRAATAVVERHHDVIGVLVEEQMNRFSDDSLTALVESRVGEDLNWIRLNGTFVGGLIGVVLYLLFSLARPSL
jgi:uncharacterized membrane-anchored protein YjiN (DUF445 family)